LPSPVGEDARHDAVDRVRSGGHLVEGEEEPAASAPKKKKNMSCRTRKGGYSWPATETGRFFSGRKN